MAEEGSNVGDGEAQKKMANIVSNACCRYLPIAGSVSALIFSTNVTNPKLLRSAFSPYELTVADALWLNAHIGTGLYIYTRRHVGLAPRPWRIAYSVGGTILFNFGTVLFWATTKALLPHSDALRTLFGVASGVAFLEVARRYLAFVDELLVTPPA